MVCYLASAREIKSIWPKYQPAGGMQIDEHPRRIKGRVVIFWSRWSSNSANSSADCLIRSKVGLVPEVT